MQLSVSEWAFVGVLLAISGILPTVPMLLGWLLGPRRPNPLKNDTYECGIETVGDAWVQFRVQYYVFALVFVVFDVEIALLFPWAVAYSDLGNSLGPVAFLAAAVFILLLAVELVYIWRKGALEWM